VTAGVFETLRVRSGRVPLLDRHAARLERACAALDLPSPESLEALLVRWGVGDDCVVRVRVGPDGVRVTSRPEPPPTPLSIRFAKTAHRPYPHKVVERGPFEAALAEARAMGADDALLLTGAGRIAEGSTWRVFWWEAEVLATPPLSLGVLPGVARARLGELTRLVEVECGPADLVGKSIFAANAVRGVVRLRSLEGRPVPGDPRTERLVVGFWPPAGDGAERRTD
jgi:branched-subunit amino acid aminotransferase/4-amino-4-deoxychorismate lyase